jgi:nucleotide-binding universal stress UspA family protein
MGLGPIIIGYDGSATAQRAIDEAGALMSRHQALVVVVYERDVPFEFVEVPTMPPAPIDIRFALEVDSALYDAARQMARHGAQLAEKAGLEAEPLVVADILPVADTLIRVAKERDSQAIVVGTHGRFGLRDILLGSTARDVIKRSPAPVLVVRAVEDVQHDRS